MYFWQASSICTVDRHRVAFPALIGKGGGRMPLGPLLRDRQLAMPRPPGEGPTPDSSAHSDALDGMILTIDVVARRVLATALRRGSRHHV